MRNLMMTGVLGLGLAAIGIGLPGCGDTTETQEKTKITTPGGTATETHDVKVNKTGSNPPAAPSEKMP
jgi:hypothetical protein